MPRGPRRARRLVGFGITALLHLAVIAALLRAGPRPSPPPAPAVVSVHLLPAMTAPPPPRAEPRPAVPPQRLPAPPPRPPPPARPAEPAPHPAAEASDTPQPVLDLPNRAAPATDSATTAATLADTLADTHADPAADDARVAAAYVQELWTRIAAARPSGTALQGQALVGFTLDADGRLVALELLQSSGSGLLDRLALRTVRRAAPFPPPPAAAGRDFRIVFRFG